MTFTETGQLYLLPCDHRDILRALHVRSGSTLDERTFVVAAKQLVLDGLLRAVDEGVDLRSTALLMDDELGGPVLERARSAGVARFLPVDTGEVGPFRLQHGERFAQVVEDVDPEVVTALVAFHPDGAAGPDPDDQLQRMAPLAQWQRATERPFMLELQVSAPAEVPEGWVDAERPALVARAVQMLCEAGFAPDIWKVEGCTDVAGYALVHDAVRRSDRPDAELVVLGAGASEEVVDGWLRAAAASPGYTGFAVGRSVWSEGVTGWAHGTLTGEQAVAAIAGRYRHFAQTFGESFAGAAV